MTVTYRYESNILIIEMVAEYTTAEVQTAIVNSFSNSKCPPKPFLLIDLTESRSIFNRSSDEVRTVAGFVASFANRVNHRIALVAHEDLPYGLMRMGSVGSEERGIESQVFRSFDEARKWLLT